MDPLARSLQLEVLEGSFAICRLEAREPAPSWAADSAMSFTRTPDERSVVCLEGIVPPGVIHDRGWRCLKVAGTFSLAETGVLASILQPLAHARISIFVVSSFSTDYILIKENSLQDAVRMLTEAGHTVLSGGTPA